MNGNDAKPENLHNMIEAYAKVYPKLKLHPHGYPDPETIRCLVKNGQGNQFNFGDG